MFQQKKQSGGRERPALYRAPMRRNCCIHAVVSAGARTVAVMALVLAGSAVHAQSTAMIGGNGPAHMQQEAKSMAAEERQKKMLSDADKLVEMAQELKVAVDKSNKDTLSVDVVREAEKIERLARQVKDNMRQ